MFDACLVYWHFHKSRWKDSLIRFRSSSVSCLSFLLMLISTHWMRCEKWCCCLFTLLKNSQTLREEEAPLLQTRQHTYARVYVHCQSVRCSNNRNKRKSQNVCRHQPLEIFMKKQHTKRWTSCLQEQAKIPSVRLLLHIFIIKVSYYLTIYRFLKKNIFLF